VIVETEEDLIIRLHEWKDDMENRGLRVNMNKTKVMISGERQKVTQKAVRWPCCVCGRHIHTTVLRPSWILSRVTLVSRHQKGKTRKVKPTWIYWSKR